MERQPVKIMKKVEFWVCRRCENEWRVMGASPPMQCPKCKSPRWDIPRKAKTWKGAPANITLTDYNNREYPTVE